MFFVLCSRISRCIWCSPIDWNSALDFVGRPRGSNEVSIQDIWSCRCRSCSRRLHRISLGWFRLVFRLLGSERIRSLNLCQGCSKCLSPTIIYKIIVKYKNTGHQKETSRTSDETGHRYCKVTSSSFTMKFTYCRNTFCIGETLGWKPGYFVTFYSF